MNVYIKKGCMLLLIAIGTVGFVWAQELKHTTFEELETLQQVEPRPVLVFLTAQWCTYCKRIEEKAFKEPELIHTLNEHFYFILFDIEEKKTIQLGDLTFHFRPSGLDTGVHELAEKLGTIRGTLTTPTFVILKPQFEIIYQYAGYLDTAGITTLLEIVLQNTSSEFN